MHELGGGSNLLTGTLDILGNYKDLTIIWFDDNSFTGNIEFMKHLSKLKEIDLSYNHLTGSLSYLQNLSDLGSVELGHNAFDSGMTEAFGPTVSSPFTQLGYLDLSHNQLTSGLEELMELTSLPALVGLQLTSNPFESSILPSFVPPGDERVFVLDVADIPFHCPFPTLGPNVLVERDDCVQSWEPVMSLTGIGVLMTVSMLMLYRYLCFPPSKLLQRFIWTGQWLNNVLQMAFFMNFAGFMIQDARVIEDGCGAVNDPAVFDPFIDTVAWTVPLPPYQSFREYVELLLVDNRVWNEQYIVPFALDSFSQLCNRFS